MRKIALLLCLFTSLIGFSQEDDKFENEIPLDSLFTEYDFQIIEQDSLTIGLHEVKLLKKIKFNTSRDRNYYYWLRKKTYKAYPFAKMATERLNSLNERLKKIESKRKRRKYTKRIQKYLEEEFTDQLKKLTKTEGRILIKLIKRQTGNTAFDLVKELRSGWKAFWYNTTANLFSLSLKTEYDPLNNDEDYIIEDILQRAFQNGYLEEQDPAFEIDYFEITEQRRKEDRLIDTKMVNEQLKKYK
ncbi:DUF4294 domain-containing protein [Aureivirga marina]|uniref:DUF4294 domain-containing protein n=1 Tax=Aureivirga marina TaxID=1182451 RepID=UPI0018C9E346|nr:DUF4294 domain-containing protein [Aureivirga marina]